ncbi:MAG: hypothetical protein KF760_23645 [Candidatus Eremiobacteraeota bacterium]|nr:hypothetical protein [Candidatus Eremiobacteraeota bacterium]MCW5866219.1 hypothetical protein [Candidatus Eremiobacteraeota bacterium]
MRGIVHLGDLQRGYDPSLESLLEKLGFPLGPVVTHCPHPPPELAVLGGQMSELSLWLSECEVILQLEGDQLHNWVTADERWRPELPEQPADRVPLEAGIWWPLDFPRYLEPCALAPGLQGSEVIWKGWRYDLRSGAKLAQIEESKRYFGFFPELGLAMDGGRCRFRWVWLTAGGACDLAANTHDWPVGHAKKLYGYRDNDPVRGEISWDHELYLSVYEVDVVISSVPFPWHEIVAGVVALIWPPKEPIHSVFYRLNPDFPEDEEEDARDGPPALVLGPGSGLCYALALDQPVMRRWVGGHERVDSGLPEYAIFDRQHRRVRTGRGRLLGGNARRLVVWLEGKLYAEDFLSGERQLFGYEGSEIAWALPVNAGWNLVLLRRDENGPVCVRLI